MAGNLPEGMVAQAAMWIPPGTDSLQQAVVSCSWRIEVLGAEPAAMADRIAEVLSLDELPHRGRPQGQLGRARRSSRHPRNSRLADEESHTPVVALRPSTVLEADLATQPRSLRPAELVRALSPDWSEGLVLRTHQWTLVDGARHEPIPLGDESGGATSTVHATMRAS